MSQDRDCPRGAATAASATISPRGDHVQPLDAVPQTENGCGSCTLCCKLLGVSEIAKPAGTWCRHCAVGRGCGIYASRPRDCQTYVCLWRQMRDEGRAVDAALRPDRCKVIIDADLTAPVHYVRVTPEQPDAWRKPLVQRFLAAVLRQGGRLALVNGERQRWLKAVG